MFYSKLIRFCRYCGRRFTCPHPNPSPRGRGACNDLLYWMGTGGPIYHQHPSLPLGEGSGVRAKMPKAKKNNNPAQYFQKRPLPERARNPGGSFLDVSGVTMFCSRLIRFWRHRGGRFTCPHPNPSPRGRGASNDLPYWVETGCPIYRQNTPLPLGEGLGVRAKMPKAKKTTIPPNILKNAFYLNQQGIRGFVSGATMFCSQLTRFCLQQELWRAGEVYLPSPQPLSQRERGLK